MITKNKKHYMSYCSGLNENIVCDYSQIDYILMIKNYS